MRDLTEGDMAALAAIEQEYHNQLMKAPEAAQRAPLLRRLRAIARAYGYALAEHGSVARDWDLVAVPWVVDAAPPEALVRSLAAGLPPAWYVLQAPTPRAHHRWCWVMVWDEIEAYGVKYLDLSVLMPPHESVRLSRAVAEGRLGAFWGPAETPPEGLPRAVETPPEGLTGG